MARADDANIDVASKSKNCGDFSAFRRRTPCVLNPQQALLLSSSLSALIKRGAERCHDGVKFFGTSRKKFSRSGMRPGWFGFLVFELFEKFPLDTLKKLSLFCLTNNLFIGRIIFLVLIDR